ncbi:MAG: TetR/AcrR family transcriptional regulator [Burkholderiaceae bacterium]|nr:TetR/AcrR family transcriptional regulator [Burkholderiaceae bacterium]
MPRTAGSDGARTHEAIRQAAIALIAERGFEAMTLRELAGRVGLQPGSLYRYFPSKNRMLVELMLEHLQFLLDEWQRVQPETADPRERLCAFVDFHIRSHTLRRQEVFVANMELRSLAPADRRRVVALRRRYEDGLTGILRAGVEGGAFHVRDPRIAAFAVLAMLTGVGTWFNDAGRIGKRDLIDQYTQLVLQCVGSAPANADAPAPSQRRSH